LKLYYIIKERWYWGNIQRSKWKWIVYRTPDNKVLKSINYSPADIKGILGEWVHENRLSIKINLLMSFGKKITGVVDDKQIDKPYELYQWLGSIWDNIWHS
jgi:hypothetical protein